MNMKVLLLPSLANKFLVQLFIIFFKKSLLSLNLLCFSFINLVFEKKKKGKWIVLFILY